ncbi:MAG: MerR family transcriptional regulator [Rhodoferax sp.]|nr:MerR family transcriptional regulator [Rhodoferax sp.]
MNISQLAQAAKVTTDTVRYYEKQGLLSVPQRQDNGYRLYTEAHAEALRFVRGAQALGFSLTEIRAIQPQLAQGKLGRADIEQQLQTKMAQIDAHIHQLQTLKKELSSTFALLRCTPTQTIVAASATASDSGSGAGAAVVRKAFAKPRSRQ